jgi:hypothetical protein
MLRAPASRSVVGTALCGALVTSGCLHDESPKEPVRRELAWDFAGRRSLPKMRLWPSTSTTPERLKRSMSTERDHNRLRAHVEGKDPYFVWRFENAITAGVVSVDVEASQPGLLQLFWSSSQCPTFRESCSLKEYLSGGRQWVDFLTDGIAPMRELRLDLPEAVDFELWFHEIAIFERAELSPRWVGTEGVALSFGPDGLDMVSRSNDPWMTVTTPGLDASPFDEVELVLHATVPTAPQLFWEGPCEHFEEACSVLFVPADAGALTHKARLSRVPKWQGAIRTLRLDPGSTSGEYTVDRIALLGPNAQRARR